MRLFASGSNRMFKLIPGDVGRPLTDIASGLDYPDLADDVREVLRTLVVHERPAAARDGYWFLVRIAPYRTLENMIDGVVITMTDISASRTVEAQLRATQTGLESQIADRDRQLKRTGEALRSETQRRQAGKGGGGEEPGGGNGTKP